MGEQPMRIQLRRTRGWRMPENTVKVTRPSLYGNPFVHADPAEAVAAFRQHCRGDTQVFKMGPDICNLPGTSIRTRYITLGLIGCATKAFRPSAARTSRAGAGSATRTVTASRSTSIARTARRATSIRSGGSRTAFAAIPSPISQRSGVGDGD
jgi:hypothetical protein